MNQLPALRSIPVFTRLHRIMGPVLLAAALPTFALGAGYNPPWESAVPKRTLTHAPLPGATPEQNGSALLKAAGALQPGDRLEIGAGTYSVERLWDLRASGSAEAPVWIVAAHDAKVIITRPDAKQNVLNVGMGGTVSYLCLRGLEFTGGSHGIRLGQCRDVWVDQCHIHHTGEVCLSANSADTQRLHLTRNHIHHGGGHAEGMYLGGNHASVVMSRSIIALNHIHDCRGSQGDGIEVKQGSWGNLISENHVHDCNYPCITVYGTGGQPMNVIERNLCYRSGDNVIQVQGEAIVRNNVLLAGKGSGFASTDHQGKTLHLQVIHNTIINPGHAFSGGSWNAREGMVLANNILYSRDGSALHFANGSAGATITGNILLGSGPREGGVPGRGLEDFRNVTWDALQHDATPTPEAPIGHADAKFLLETDFYAKPRGTGKTSGAITLLATGAKTAHPGNYHKAIASLSAGDTLRLEPGIYPTGLPLTDCHGRPDAWITIEGPAEGVAEIRQSQVANCVELRQCRYVALKRLKIQGGGPSGIPGLFGISAKESLTNTVHHILVEDCLISDWNTSQQAVGVSTKTPTWGWTIRRNQILNCGTGLYLGNSNGHDPFIQGVIENNLVQNPIGYCMEIKFQKTRPAVAGMPETPGSTLIRHNTFIKNDAPSPDGDRPNLLVGGFPASGPGAEDLYEIHGNLLGHNPRESLLQASGRVAIHDNVFVDHTGAESAAITLRDHDTPLKLAHLYNNTIFSAVCGIRIAHPARDGHAIIGNVIFAGTPLKFHQVITQVSGNLTGPISDAVHHLMQPSTMPARMNLRPRAGQCQGTALDLSLFKAHTDYDRDFDGNPKGRYEFRGAYAGDTPKP